MDLITDTKQKMGKVLDVLHGDLATVRTGRAAPSLIENIVVSVYGNTTRLKIMEVATISTIDPHTLQITPFDGSIIGEIQKGIEVANTGLTPVIDGQLIRISIPQLSEERRQELIKLMHQKLENAKIMIRQVRHDGMTEIKKQELPEDEKSRMEKEMQKITDELTSEIDAMGRKKEEDLMQI